ncbi:hypothetical protein, partial [Xanthomonas campestris]|uniref:hypothetical protein n=1 Tax=Xanthomonas campestris TaxID=339 RepID=UPI001C84E483
RVAGCGLRVAGCGMSVPSRPTKDRYRDTIFDGHALACFDLWQPRVHVRAQVRSYVVQIA